MRVLDSAVSLFVCWAGAVAADGYWAQVNQAPRDGSKNLPIRLAYTGSENVTRLPELLLQATGLHFKVVRARDDVQAVKFVARGDADVAEVDPFGAYVATEAYKLTTLYGEMEGGDVSAVALVWAGSTLRDFNDLFDKKSCHAGFQSSSGMIVPMGYAVRSGYISPGTNLEDSVRRYFSKSCAPPNLCGLCADVKIDGQCHLNDTYGGFAGALRCLAQGTGEVAFVRNTTYDEICGSKAKTPPKWCPEKSELLEIASTGLIPTHRVVANLNRLARDVRNTISFVFVNISRTSNQELLPYFNNGKSQGFYAIGSGSTAAPESAYVDYRRVAACVPGTTVGYELTASIMPVCELANGVQVEAEDTTNYMPMAVAGLVLALFALLLTPVLAYVFVRSMIRDHGKGQDSFKINMPNVKIKKLSIPSVGRRGGHSRFHDEDEIEMDTKNPHNPQDSIDVIPAIAVAAEPSANGTIGVVASHSHEDDHSVTGYVNRGTNPNLAGFSIDGEGEGSQIGPVRPHHPATLQ